MERGCKTVDRTQTRVCKSLSEGENVGGLFWTGRWMGE